MYDMLRSLLIAGVVAIPTAAALVLLLVSLSSREPIPWADMWRALTGRRK